MLATGGGHWDTLAGGDGDDAYVVNSSRVKIVEESGEGTDTVYSGAGYLSVAAAVERFVLLDTARDLMANDLDNLVFGNAGDNRLGGRGGDDYIDGGDGLDTATYSGDFEDYDISRNDDGSFRITDLAGKDGTDTLIAVEIMAFADQHVAVSDLVWS